MNRLIDATAVLAALDGREIGTILWLITTGWALYDLLHGGHTRNAKVAWAVVVVIIPFAGPLAYYLLGRRPKPNGAS